MTPAIEFESAFEALTGHTPLRWQSRLFKYLFLESQIPQTCDLPTGLGKTSVIPIFVIALACQSQQGVVNLPRRLAYVVNRRTVVDQATGVVERLRERLISPLDPRWQEDQQPLEALVTALRRLSSAEEADLPLAVSTLRGELADNEQWKADPSRLAIIIGTIDMIGSKLLFSGYGDGRYWRAQHAGLIGQDTLIIHDEAHLTPAFSDLLHQLGNVQRKAAEPRPVQVMELSATSRGQAGPALRLEAEDERDQIVTDRLDAVKKLRLHRVEAENKERQKVVHKEALEKIVELSLSHQDEQVRVLVYVQSPEDASYIAERLKGLLGVEADDRVALLTGTIRGFERDMLVRGNPVYRALLNPESSVDASVYLVSTSAGEVGIDIDADHMVCDLTTLDSLVQRLGRVNRRGGPGRVAQVDVIMQSAAGAKGKTTDAENAMGVTREILNEWSSGGGIDASPRNLRRLLDSLDEERKDHAFAPKSATPALTDILLDAWSLTSVNARMPGRPEVAAYLHGIEKEPPETYVAWRSEVTLLHKAGVDLGALSEWFQACRIESHERLRDHTYRVMKLLDVLLSEHRRKDKRYDFPVAVLDERGEAQWKMLSSIAENDLEYRTLVLPIEAGGLKDGALDSKQTSMAPDVAEDSGRRRERLLERRNADGQTSYERLGTGERTDKLPPGLRQRFRLTLEQPAEETGEGGVYLLLRVEPKESSLEPEDAATQQTLEFHGRSISGCMAKIADKLCLTSEQKRTLIMASEQHDRGKGRPIWQRYAGNPKVPLAKFTAHGDPHILSGYRHEYGSLLDAAADRELQNRTDADLALHLIAAHHGWARPYFERKGWDWNSSHTAAENEEAASEVMRRFARMQQRYGRWGLAWLESLLRCADIAASNIKETGPMNQFGSDVK